LIDTVIGFDSIDAESARLIWREVEEKEKEREREREREREEIGEKEGIENRTTTRDEWTGDYNYMHIVFGLYFCRSVSNYLK